MKKYLIDTSVFVDHFRGDKRATGFLKQIDGKMVVSGTTLGELLQGVKNKQELKDIKELFSFLEVVWCTPRVEKMAHSLLSDYNLKFGIEYLDCLISAHALKDDFQLVTHNIKHFKGVKNLMVIAPAYLN